MPIPVTALRFAVLPVRRLPAEPCCPPVRSIPSRLPVALFLLIRLSWRSKKNKIRRNFQLIFFRNGIITEKPVEPTAPYHFVFRNIPFPYTKLQYVLCIIEKLFEAPELIAGFHFLRYILRYKKHRSSMVAVVAVEHSAECPEIFPVALFTGEAGIITVAFFVF